jgi:hypothetical protein
MLGSSPRSRARASPTRAPTTATDIDPRHPALLVDTAPSPHISARLIVRGVPDLNPTNQSELFTACRYPSGFTDSPVPMLTAEKAHRAHAIVEPGIADSTTVARTPSPT